MHGVMKIIHGWVESASTGLKLATVCNTMCVSFTSAEVVMYLNYQLLLALAISIRASGSVWEGSTRLLLIL